MPITDQLGTNGLENLTFGIGATYGGTDYDKSVNQSLSLVSQVSVSITYDRSISQSLTLTEIGVKVLDGSGTSTLTLSSDATSLKVKNRSIISTLTLTSSVTVSCDHIRSINQGLTLSENALKSIYRNESLTNSLSFSGTCTGISSKLASNSLTLSQTTDVKYIYGGHSYLELTSTCNVSTTIKRTLYSNLGPFQSIVFNGTYRRSVNSSLTLTNSAIGKAVKSAKNILTLSQLVDGVLCKPGQNTLILTGSVNVSVTHNTSNLSRLNFTQSLIVKKSKFVQANSVLAFNEFARGTKVLSRSLTENLTLVNDLVRVRTIATLESDLTLTEILSKSKIAFPSINELLTLVNSVSVSKTYYRSINDSLVFRNTFEKYVAISGRQTVSVPIVQVVKVKRVVILQSDTTTIVLPTPEFGDKQGGTGKLNIKRAMDGTRFIYKRDSPSSKLSYDFVIDRVKAIELRQFLLNNNSKFLTMENWKGERWAVLLTNNPFTFTETAYWDSPYGNKCSISLDFQGVRLN